ncbi:uncharacterized protein LOC128198763 [Bicyclus anynana]|uniref:Uncharacterized protein LOC128198763 n=1 Tax=Bicyclus anynana TaxID=110368 RepID=A0ABM3LRA4_BICAN|nr:uncharacterized protein LOC128198763 [Bicyclus anynana]
MSMSVKGKTTPSEVATAPSTSSSRSVNSVKSAPLSMEQVSQKAKKNRPTKSLRERVLVRSASRRSSLSEDTQEKDLSSQLENAPTETVTERVSAWVSEEKPPQQVESDEESSDCSSVSEALQGRKSLIHFTSRRTGVEMDLASKQANDMLLKGKDALEAAGNMKRECKQTALECLQCLYETVLSLSDSRARHKYNLEKERQRHAQELVRVERAHNKLITGTLSNITNQISQLHTQTVKNSEETNAIRSWLGHETAEPYRQIKHISQRMVHLENAIGKVALQKWENPNEKKAKGDHELTDNNQARITTQLDQLSKQLDELRRGLDRIANDTGRILKDDTKTRNSEVLEIHRAETGKGLTEVKEAIEKAESKICQTIAKAPVASATSPAVQGENLERHLQPITERLEAVSSELRTMRETRSKTPPPMTSLGAELALAELAKATAPAQPTYAQMARKPRIPQPNHTLIVSSTDPQKSGENVIDTIREALDCRNSGARVDRIRKGRNQKVILSCNSKDDLKLVKNKIQHGQSLKVEEAKTNNPLARVRDVLAYHTDAEIVETIKKQNDHLLVGLSAKDIAIRVRYRKKARNALECHPVLELSPEVHKRFLEAGKIYVGLQRRPIVDQSPLQGPELHIAKGASSIKIIQANLQRSKLATSELLETAHKRGVLIALIQEPYVGKTGLLKQHPGTQVIQCTLNRQKPVKAAIIVFGDKLEVIHDPQIVTETEAAVLLKAGPMRLGLISVYYEGDQEIEPYMARTQSVCQRLKTGNLIIGGDVNAKSHWWGWSSEDERGADYVAFLNDMDFHIINTGDTPTFEVYRRGKLCSSIVDVTACSLPLLGKIENWRVDRSITSADHNGVTFTLRLESELKPLKPITTRRYNTRKAAWSEFATHFRNSILEKNITPQAVEDSKSPEELEAIVSAYVTAIQEACDHAIPVMGSWKGSPTPPWWSGKLNQLKAQTLRAKRKIRNAAPSRRDRVIEEYIKIKEKYAEEANKAQTESWKEFCTTQKKESMWDGVYRVIRKTTRRPEDMLLRNAEGNTLSPEESAELLAKTFYPDDKETTDKPYHRQLREWMANNHKTLLRSLPEDDPSFTLAELESVLKAMNPKKAPGPDGLTADICTRAIACNRELFMSIANKCLSLQYFPGQWKVAHVIILRKSGKEDYTHPKSYRPIGLLSILGKIVEKLMIGRLQWHTLPAINRAQYGFMPQRGTEDSLYDLVNHIKSEVGNKKIVLLISLDIEGAFDNAWWPALKNKLIEMKCPRNLYAMVCSYLTDRKIRVNYARAAAERKTTKGCVQGSIGGPTFWNLILDSLLNKLTGEGVYSQAFADDVVLVFSGHEMAVIEETANNTLAGVVRWGKRNKLHFAAHKTNAMIITRKLKYDLPILHMSQNRLQLVKEIKLLGLIIDHKLTFEPHVKAIRKKTAEIYKQLACAARVTWGLNSEITRTIYVAVIEPIVLYAGSVWYPATELQMIRDLLNGLQRGYAQKICKAYRTVSLTSALVLSGLLPLDIRVQEAAQLYLAKKGKSKDFLPPGREMEQWVHYLDQPHPSTLTETNYEILETLDEETINSHHVTGPIIYTDGSKIDGKVGAALTWWENGAETKFQQFKLDPACTVFQAELYALHKAVLLAKRSDAPQVNIMSDSRSSLELLENPKTKHQIARIIKDNIIKIVKANRKLRLFWIRAHIGTPGNERADELAKIAAANTNTSPHYTKIPLSYVKRKIREESVRKWQDRYLTSETGQITKIFFPDVGMAYALVRKIGVNYLLCQAFTGHGGFAQYLCRFKLKDSPGCECDNDIEETIEHVILDCPRFGAARMRAETRMDTVFTLHNLHTLLADPRKRDHLISYLEEVTRITTRRNSTLIATQPGDQDSNKTAQDSNNTPRVEVRKLPITQLLNLGSKGEPGIRIRGVALYMDDNAESLGISFCNADASGRVVISPGLAALLNGSTSKNTMKRSRYREMPETSVAGVPCKVVRAKNKVIVLFRWDYPDTPFARAGMMLKEVSQVETATPKCISVDAMVVGYTKGTIEDYVGCLDASKRHEVVIYENRGEDLSFLKTRKPKPMEAPPAQSVAPEAPSGSEKLQQKRAHKEDNTKTPSTGSLKSSLKLAVNKLARATQRISGDITTIRVEKAIQTFTTNKQQQTTKPAITETPRSSRTRADKGEIVPPALRNPRGPLDHIINAFVEFLAITKADQTVAQNTCQQILQAWEMDNTGLLKVRLEAAEASLYDNNTQKNILGIESGDHMKAYSATYGLVDRIEEESRMSGSPPPQKFKVPQDDPVVVIARCTRIMLNEKIQERAKTIAGNNDELLELWDVPIFTWVNGVPGCGKTTWIVNNFDPVSDVVTTTTTEAAKDLRERLTPKVGKDAKIKVRTMASILANGLSEPTRSKCKRLIVDEALMNHFGAIIMATKLVGADETLLIGDKNQLPYIDRNNLFQIRYNRPNTVARVNKELLCTHRNPMDVAYALSEVYEGIYSSKSRAKSLELRNYTGSRIPKDTDNTLYLTHTQGEKETLKAEGYGSGKDSRVNTIHEAQGATFEEVIIVRTTSKKIELHDSVSHAVVAVSRHTSSCTYYTDDKSDAIAYFISKAMSATTAEIREHNIKMAIKNGDETVLSANLTQKHM